MRYALGPSTLRFALIAVLVLEVAAIVYGVTAPVGRLSHVGPIKAAQQGDFVAFYCAGRVTREREDPYVDAPLRRCEANVYRTDASSVLPAPVPPYDLPLFAAISTIEPARALFLWLVTLGLAALATALLFEPILGLPAILVSGLFLLGAGRDDYLLGQPPPLVLLALAAAAALLLRGRFRAAAIAASAALIEPHLGVPAFASMFVFVPRCRPTLAICAATLAALSLGAVGLGGCLEYATRVLPAQVLAEVPNAFQYSTTFVLAILHVPDQIASRIGSLWYVAMTVLGIAIAGRLAERYSDAAFIPLLPPMVAVLGGSYIHEQHLVALVPGAFLLVRHTRANPLVPVAAAVASLAWEPAYLGRPMYTLVTLLLVGVALAAATAEVTRTVRIASGLALALGYFGLTTIDHRLEDRVIFRAAAPATYAAEAPWARGYPEYPWGLEVRTEVVHRDLTLGHALSKLPTWFALIALIAVAANAAYRRSLSQR